MPNNPNPFANLNDDETRNLLKGLAKAQDQEFFDNVNNPEFRPMFGAVFGEEIVDELENLAQERMSVWDEQSGNNEPQ